MRIAQSKLNPLISLATQKALKLPHLIVRLSFIGSRVPGTHDSRSVRGMEPASTTFPTLRRWRAMSEREQDALLDKIERRRRVRAIATRAAIALLCALAAALGAALVLAR